MGGSLVSQPRCMLPASNEIGCNDVDVLVTRFPPCMKYLHNCLRQKHRLKHMSRVRAITLDAIRTDISCL